MQKINNSVSEQQSYLARPTPRYPTSQAFLVNSRHAIATVGSCFIHSIRIALPRSFAPMHAGHSMSEMQVFFAAFSTHSLPKRGTSISSLITL